MNVHSDAGTIDLVQGQIAGAMRKFVGQRSAVIEAPLVDLPRKMVYGNFACAHGIPLVVRSITERIEPEAFGARLKQVGLPLALNIPSIVWCYQLGRLQRYLTAGWPDKDVDLDDHKDAATVLTWWARVCRSYRNDGKLMPGEDGAAPVMTVLGDAIVAELNEACRQRGAPKSIGDLRRSTATLGLYLWLIHGEHRDGIFHHGPYPLDDGTVLIVKELSDLRNRFMPWVTEDHRLPVSRVVVPMILHDTACTFDMFGTVYTQPEDYFEHIVAFDILAGDDLASIGEDELVGIADASRGAQRLMFGEMALWDQHMKIAHAATQYASVFHPLLELVDMEDEAIRQTIAAFEAAGDPYFESVLSGEGLAVWSYVESGRDPLFPEVLT